MSETLQCRTAPCETCPYRRDVPSGIWSADEYRKLPDYDNETGNQPIKAFYCHTSPDFLCNGWAVVHGVKPRRGYELLSLRIWSSRREIGEIPVSDVPLFASGAEAAAHGLRDLERPGIAANRAAAKVRAARRRRKARTC